MFDVYFLIRSLSYGWILLWGFRKLKLNLDNRWLSKLEELDQLSEAERLKLKIPDWRKIYHAVILPTYKEPLPVLERALDSILAAEYPQDRFIVILATEERDHVNAQKNAAAILKKYQGKFSKLMITEHPDGIIGEVKAKGANCTWAAKQLSLYCAEKGIDAKDVIVSTADVDSSFHHQYFSILTHKFITTPDRHHVGYQPIAMYFNNIWDASWLSRVMAFSTTFWQIIESVREYRLVTFSTHAMTLSTLQEIDYWCISIVNEDSRQYFRAWFHYNGNFRTVPLFVPLYMDAVLVPGWYPTFKNLYLQQQRWAYGVEHFPYIVLECARNHKIPWRGRVIQIFRAFSGTYTWATSAFFITFVGWLPLILNPGFQANVAASYFPIVTQVLLSLTWIGLLISGVITLRLINTVRHGRDPIQLSTMFLQWVFTPIASLLLGALPGIDAQTRLMFGKYMGFRVTEKSSTK